MTRSEDRDADDDGDDRYNSHPHPLSCSARLFRASPRNSALEARKMSRCRAYRRCSMKERRFPLLRHYRKEATGNLTDDTQLRTLEERLGLSA